MTRKTVVGVMGPGNGATANLQQTAYELGKLIALQGWVLLTGGRNVGVMDAASRGAKGAGGLTVGVLPSSDFSHLSEGVDLAIATDLGNARNNVNVLSSDVVVACGMGAGTASEVALAIKNGKTVILLEVDSIAQQFFTNLSPQSIKIAQDVNHAVSIAITLINSKQND